MTHSVFTIRVPARTAVLLGLSGLMLSLAAAIGLAAPVVINALTWTTKATSDSAQPVTWGW